MALLAGTCYDPGTAVTNKDCTALLAMTAFDTTNLRLTFTAPASGNVLVRLRCGTSGSTTLAGILLGVLDGATVKLRMSPMGSVALSSAATIETQEAVGVVTGLTPGNSYTWDAAYGVEIVGGSGTNIKYGGPDDASGADAWGGFVFEVWEAANLLAGTLYDPSTAATKVTTALKAMTAFDTTNLRLTFTAPASGLVMWRVHTVYFGNGNAPQFTGFLGVLESATVVGRISPLAGLPSGVLASGRWGLDASGIASVSAGSHTWDAAYAIQTVTGASGALKYGGPNDTTTNNAWGGFAFEVWEA